MSELAAIIIIAHSGLDRRITKEECLKSLDEDTVGEPIFIEFESGNNRLSELYSLPFENIALIQQRDFNSRVKPILEQHPSSRIAYFGLAPIPVSFHLGVLVGNTHACSIYQLHHSKNVWYKNIATPSEEYSFQVDVSDLPKEIQRGKGDVVIRIATSFNIDPQATQEVVPNATNEFDIKVTKPHVDCLYNQEVIEETVQAFQNTLNGIANHLFGREKIHFFIATSAGLPFALGRRINPTIYPFIQTYQYSATDTPKYKEAIFISKESEDRPQLSPEQRGSAADVRVKWENQLSNKIKPFVKTITPDETTPWLETICTKTELEKISESLKQTWSKVPNVANVSLKDDRIDLDVKDVEDGFEFVDKTNSWNLDDGFLFGLENRLSKKDNADILQAGRLFLFHEALHYSKKGHNLDRSLANEIGRFPKVIEEADYQADVWALITEYKFCSIYEPGKLQNGVKQFFSNALETAVETMWSFADNGNDLNAIQVRLMNRFLNWYWQLLRIEAIDGKGTIEDVICILFNKPVIEFSGAPMDLRGHRTYFKLNTASYQTLQLAAFAGNRIYRFTPPNMSDFVNGFKKLNGEKIKAGLKGFQIQLAL